MTTWVILWFITLVSHIQGKPAPVVNVGARTQLHICSSAIIRVTHTPTDNMTINKTSLVAKADWPEVLYHVTHEGNQIIVTTEEVKVVGNTVDGKVSFFDINKGSLLLVEGSRNFTKWVDMGNPTYKVEQSWTSPNKESFYGGGEFQNGILNYKNAPVQLVQFNTEAIVPMFVSSQGYGLYWDAYSWSWLNPVGIDDLISSSGPPIVPLEDGNPVDLEVCDPTSYLQQWSYSTDTQDFIMRSEPSNPKKLLDCDRCTDGRSPHIWHVDGDFKSNQQWTYNNQQLKSSAHTTCLSSDNGIIMKICDTGDATQKWIFNESTGLLSQGNKCLSAKSSFVLQNFTTTVAGDYYLYVDGCPSSFGCGGKTVQVIIYGPNGENQTVQSWENLANMPDSLTGRATNLLSNTLYRVSFSSTLKDAKLYVRSPAYNRTTLRSDNENLIDYYFMLGHSVDGTISLYRNLAGEAYLYPAWAYGFWQCKQRYHTQHELVAAATKFRNLSIPIDNIVQDWHYWGNLGWGPQWDSSIYPDPAAMVKTLSSLNFHLMVSVWSKFDTKTKFYKNMTAQGMMIPHGTYYDPYNAAAREQFYQFSKEVMFSIGVDSLWLDATEPENFPNRNEKVALGSGNAYFNSYSLMTSKAIADGLRRDYPTKQGARVFSLTRSSFAGQQRTGAALWSGDISGAWDALRRQISASINFQLSGMPYWSEDIGGFFRPGNQGHDPDYQLLLTRWFQFGSFTPIFRVHGNGVNTELWNYPATTMENIIQTALNLRYRLFPYTYSGFWMVQSEGYTMQRGLVFDFAYELSSIANINDQFMWGPALMICPIYTTSDTRKVYLPPLPNLPLSGSWTDFFSGSKMISGYVTAHSPINIGLPIFVRSGSIVPMGPYLQYWNEKHADPMEIRVYGGADGRFVLYEDDGVSPTATTKSATIQFYWSHVSSTLSISKRNGSFPGMLNTRTFNVVFVAQDHGVGVAPTKTPDHVVHYNGSAVNVTKH